MNEIILTHEQNIRAALVFLNVFGLILDIKDEINDKDCLKVYDQSNKEVGSVTIKDNKVNISAKCIFGGLVASYKYVKVPWFVDVENKENEIIFASWCTKIDYEVKFDEIRRLSGDFLINAYLDTEFNVKCLFHPALNFYVNDVNTANLILQRNNKIFSLELLSDNTTELIEIKPFDDFGDYIHHVIKKKNDGAKKEYPYIKSSSIAIKSEIEKDKLRFLKYEKEFDNYLDYEKTIYEKKSKQDTKDLIIQVGSIMQQKDKDMYNKIKELQYFLSKENFSLLDNLIYTSFVNYDDDEVMALLGLEKKPLNFQQESLNLNDAYFGPSGKNKFIKNTSKSKTLIDKK